MFHDLRFPLAAGVTQEEVAACPDGVKNFIPEGPRFWNWLAPRRNRPRKKVSDMMLDSCVDAPVYARTFENAAGM
jgi:hypothetical protein